MIASTYRRRVKTSVVSEMRKSIVEVPGRCFSLECLMVKKFKYVKGECCSWLGDSCREKG